MDIEKVQRSGTSQAEKTLGGIGDRIRYGHRGNYELLLKIFDWSHALCLVSAEHKTPEIGKMGERSVSMHQSDG